MNYYLPKLLKIASYIYKRELNNQKTGAMELHEQFKFNGDKIIKLTDIS
jgi:hypothetical protein